MDKETGLVWERSPTGSGNWFEAQEQCINRTVGNRRGWRLPTVQEFASLLDPSGNPELQYPFDAPFNYSSIVTASAYWTATSSASNPQFAWGVVFFGGSSRRNMVQDRKQAGFAAVWCVRGGQGSDPQ